MNKSTGAALAVFYFTVTSKVFAGIPIAPVVLSDVQKQLVVETCATHVFDERLTDQIEKLLLQGAVIDGAYPHNAGLKPFMMTCLMEAAINGNVDLARFLIIEKNAKSLLKTKTDGHGAIAGYTPVDQVSDYFLSEGGWNDIPGVADIAMQMTQLLLSDIIQEADEIKFPMNEPVGGKGQKPVAFAAEFGADQVLGVLLGRRLDPDTTGTGGMRAVSLAALHGHLNAVKMLVAAGATLACDEETGCPIIDAAHRKHEDVIRYLIEQRVDVNAEINGISALFAATESGSCHPSLLRALISAGANPNFVWIEKLNDGRVQSHVTALINAVKNSDIETDADRTEIVRALLEGGANPNLGDKYEKNALTLARAWGQTGVVELLLKYGADPNP